MKLAFIINVFREDDFHSGGEKLFYELVSRSINDGYKVDLYCTSYLSSKNMLKNRLNRLTLLGHPKDFKYPHKIEAFYKNVKKLTQTENYDFIISENISPVIDTEKHIGILQGHSQAHYRNRAGNIFSQVLFGIKKYRHISAQKKWLKTPYKRIIVPSNVLKEELVQNFGIAKEKIFVMHPGVDTPIEAISTSKADVPFTFGLSAPSFGKKGGYVFLNALNQLKRRGYDFRAKIIYPKHAKNIGLQLALSRYGLRNVVEFLPYQEDMSEFYSSVDCVVMPSVLETFGLVALEGMINGKPAIVSSFCGAKEIITDGENGFVFDMEGNASGSLADRMELFLNNSVDYSILSRKAREKASTYSWEAFYKQFKSEVLNA
jgi:glycosyltransferase involved in cell wall biosynthesis